MRTNSDDNNDGDQTRERHAETEQEKNELGSHTEENQQTEIVTDAGKHRKRRWMCMCMCLYTCKNGNQGRETRKHFSNRVETEHLRPRICIVCVFMRMS